MTDGNTPSITIAICVKDGQKYLAEAINSARRQSHTPIQILVIDDDSADRSRDLANALGCDVIVQSSKGLGAARNVAFSQAKGECVFFLDSDDVMPDGSLRSLVHALNATPGAIGAVGFRQDFVSPELYVPATSGEPKQLARNRGLLSTGALWDTSLGSTISFNEDSLVTDVEWGLDLMESGLVIAESNETVIYRRVHLSNMSGREEVRKAYLSLAIKRRKSALDA
jgi:glycosyltransferase involved in cell wall biosynthesis